MPRARRFAICSALVLAVLAGSRAHAIDDTASNERVGVRAGYLETFDGLHGYYGDAWNIALFFNEKIFSKLMLDIRLGAIYLGDLKDPNLDDFITNQFGVVSEMRSFYFSVGPMVGKKLSNTYVGYASVGVGIYSMSQIFDSGVQSFDFSEQYIGANANLGVSRRISTNWCIDVSATVHYVGTGEGPDDLYWLFTGLGQAEEPIFVGFDIGATLDLR